MLAQLRRVLADANYTEAGIGEALGQPNAEFRFPYAERPLLLRRLEQAESGTLASVILIKLFVLGCPVSRAEATQALRPLDLEQLRDLLELSDETVSSPLRLTPYAGFIFAHDPDGPPPLAPEYVMGIGPATRTLAGLTLREPVQRALDMGTGCGTQALLAARHAEQVIAVELNPRAVWLARINTELNDVHNVEVREGSLFEPVAGMDFDLIVSNPPYVISPDSTFIFRDSGRPGDTLCRAVVAQSAQTLREGAFAHVLCNWAHRRNQNWWEPLVDWVDGSGCDALFLRYHSQDGPTYAAQWHTDLQARDPVGYAKAIDRWTAAYRQAGIELIASGAVIIRRRSTPDAANWIRWDEMPRPPIGTGSDHAQRVFDAYDVLARPGYDDASLLGSTFRLVEGHQLTQRLVYRDAAYAVADTTMVLERGIGFVGSIPTPVLPVLLRLDGQRPLKRLVAEVAAESGTSVEELEPMTADTARELFSRGLITITGAA
jgi:hypothetical protein